MAEGVDPEIKRVLESSPAYQRIVADARGDATAARKAALDELVLVLAQEFDIEKADALAAQYGLSDDDVRERAGFAAGILHRAAEANAAFSEAVRYAREIEQHYHLGLVVSVASVLSLYAPYLSYTLRIA